MKNLTDVNFDSYVAKIIKKCGRCLTEFEMKEIQKIYDNYGAVSVNIISKQITMNIKSIFKRYRLCKENLNDKDTSSYKSFILRYGFKYGKPMFEQRKKDITTTLESMQRKYGVEIGTIKWNEMCEKRSFNLNGFILRYGEKEGLEKYNEFWRNTNFSTSKIAFIRRHGEKEGLEKYNTFKNKQKYNNSIESYIEKYGKDEGYRLYNERSEKRKLNSTKIKFVQKLLESGKNIDEINLCINRRFDHTSKKSFMLKYGDALGEEKYNNFIKNLKENNVICIEYYRKRGIPDDVAFPIITDLQCTRNKNIVNVSRESLNHLLKIVTNITSETNVPCFYGEDEYFIKLSKSEFDLSNKRIFFYDFSFTDLKLIIEYHGEKFHDDVDYNSTLNLTSDDFKKEFNMDLFKKYVAEQRGFDVKIVRSWNIKEDKMELFNYLKGRNINLCQSLFF